MASREPIECTIKSWSNTFIKKFNNQYAQCPFSLLFCIFALHYKKVIDYYYFTIT